MALKRILVFIIVLLTGGSILAQNQSFSSKLPLVFIDTNGRQIPDEPKILVDMGIVWNGQGKENHTSDDFNHYFGKVGIEIRGSSSQMFPKKSYGFETSNQAGEDVDFQILGLPEEEDWILYAPYSDKTLIRNVLTFSLAKPLGHYTSRCRFVELFLNEEYQGIYVLMEKIKREDTRVDIAKLNRWPVLGQYVWPNYYVGTSHQDEVNWLKNWLEDRLWWLDANLPGQCGEDVPGIVEEFAASVYPSPFNSELKLEVASDVSITLTLKLFNANGSLVESIPFSVVIGEQEFSMNTEHLPSGLYIYSLQKHNVVIQKGKLVKY